MKAITKHTKLNKGDYILIKRKTKDFDGFSKFYVGTLREYSHKTSLSGCIENLYINFRISGIVKEMRDVVFCWYKNSFIVLGRLELYKNYKQYCWVDIFKLSKKEAGKFVITIEDYRKYLLKEKICEVLK